MLFAEAVIRCHCLFKFSYFVMHILIYRRSILVDASIYSDINNNDAKRNIVRHTLLTL